MAKKKSSRAKHKKTSPAKKASSAKKKGGTAKKSSLAKRTSSADAKMRTPFTHAFIQQLIQAKGEVKNFLWPNRSQNGTSVVADFEAIVDVLMNVGFLQQPPAPDGSGSVRDKVSKLIQDQNWPASSVSSSTTYDDLTVHLVEIAVIIDNLLRAINGGFAERGAGGGGSTWPPH